MLLAVDRARKEPVAVKVEVRDDEPTKPAGTNVCALVFLTVPMCAAALRLRTAVETRCCCLASTASCRR